jgi:hypothetical protein
VKKIIFIRIAAFCLLFPAFAQSQTTTVKKLRIDSVTSKGKPVGEEASQEIDRSGGKVFSADGKIELIFPEGSLSAWTDGEMYN